MGYKIKLRRGGNHDRRRVPRDLGYYIQEILKESGVPESTTWSVIVRTPVRDSRGRGDYWSVVRKDPSGILVRSKTPNSECAWEFVIQPHHNGVSVDDLYAYLTDPAPKREQEAQHQNEVSIKKEVVISGSLKSLAGVAQDAVMRRKVLRQLNVEGVIPTKECRQIVKAVLNVDPSLDERGVGKFLGELAKLGYLDQVKEGDRPNGYSITKKGQRELGGSKPKPNSTIVSKTLLRDEDAIALVLLAIEESLNGKSHLSMSLTMEACKGALGEEYSEDKVTYSVIKELVRLGFLVDHNNGEPRITLSHKGRSLVEASKTSSPKKEEKLKVRAVASSPKEERGTPVEGLSEETEAEDMGDTAEMAGDLSPNLSSAIEGIERALNLVEKGVVETKLLLEKHQADLDILEKEKEKLEMALEVLKSL